MKSISSILELEQRLLERRVVLHHGVDPLLKGSSHVKFRSDVSLDVALSLVKPLLKVALLAVEVLDLAHELELTSRLLCFHLRDKLSRSVKRAQTDAAATDVLWAHFIGLLCNCYKDKPSKSKG